jgi:hypothetical protein
VKGALELAGPAATTRGTGVHALGELGVADAAILLQEPENFQVDAVEAVRHGRSCVEAAFILAAIG